MLRRNKNVEVGLVNGSVGIVESITTKTSGGKTEVQNIVINFDRIPEPVRIERESCTFEVLKGIFFTRKQFPIMLSFAITVHKSQGLSLKTAIVDAGPSCFGCGMVYVALSRVTTLSGLHLVDFDRRKVVCDEKAIAEYNRLRRLYTPHLGDMQSIRSNQQRKTRRKDLDQHDNQHKCDSVQPPTKRQQKKNRSRKHQQRCKQGIS